MKPILLFFLGLCTVCLSACRSAHDDVTEALPFCNNLDQSWGLISTDGSILIPSGCLERRPSAVVGGMFSMADENGRLYLYSIGNPARPVCQRGFASIGHFFEDVAPAQEFAGSPLLLIDKQGNEIASTAQYPQYNIVMLHNFSEGRALFATANGKYGYMDTRGRIIIPPVYDQAYDFNDGRALVGNANSQGETGYQLIDKDGKVRASIQLSDALLDTRPADERLLFRKLHSCHIGFLDMQGIPILYLAKDIQRASRFQWGLAVVCTAGRYGLIDREGTMTIPPVYEKLSVAGPGRVALSKGNLWAIADAAGTPLCGFQFDSIGHYYQGGFAVARRKGESMLIDRRGNVLENSRCAGIAEDPTASRLCPQRFWMGPDEDAGPAVGTAVAQTADEPGKDAAEAAVRNQPSTAVPAKSSRSIERKDWSKIGRQHPFYQEAVKVVSGRLEEKDAANRQMILNYVEHLRTSYTTKDIDFLEQLFSENALIVVGTVVHTAPEKESGYLPPAQVVYNIKSKRQYLERLKQVFQANRTIDLEFSNFHIMRHPTLPGIYGVSLRQQYRSDLYSDDGYLFLLWDFRDETAPEIHVRTWQPRMQPDHTPIPENEIFNISNFNLQ